MDLGIETSLAEDTFPEAGGETDCRVRIVPTPDATTGLPLHIVFCIDASKSMAGRKIERAKEGIATATNRLNADDTFAIVAFDTAADVIVEPTSGDRTEVVNDRLERIEAQYGTQIIEGLEASRKLLDSMRAEDRDADPGVGQTVNWIALLTDGRPSTLPTPFGAEVDVVSGVVDGDEVDKHAAVAAGLNDRGITVHTAGVGNEYGEDIVEALSTYSGGEWEHQSSADGIASFFTGKIEDARSVVTANPTLEFTPKNGVDVIESYQSVPQIGALPVERRGDRYVIDSVPDVRRDTPPEVIFELDAPAHDRGRDVALAEIALRSGDQRRVSRVTAQYLMADRLRRRREIADAEVSGEAEAVREYIDRKDSMDQAAKERSSRGIAKKR